QVGYARGVRHEFPIVNGRQASVADERCACRSRMVLPLRYVRVPEEGSRRERISACGLLQRLLGRLALAVFEERPTVQRENVAAGSRTGRSTAERFEGLAHGDAIVACLGDVE